MVAARHFNNVQLEGNYVVKTAAESVLRGEIFFYEHMPDDVAHLFPALISSFNAPGKARSQQRSPRPWRRASAARRGGACSGPRRGEREPGRASKRQRASKTMNLNSDAVQFDCEGPCTNLYTQTMTFGVYARYLRLCSFGKLSETAKQINRL